MSEISTVAVITAKPGSADDAGKALGELATATHGEQGCLRYSLHRSLEDPNVFVTIEKWRSKDDLDAHLSSPHMQAALAALGELMSEPPRVIPCGAVDIGTGAKAAF